MRKILLFMLLPLLATAQYSRWNYSDAQPLNKAADDTMVAFYEAAMTNHAEGELAVHVSYTYPAATDSSFELPDLGDKIIRVFDPTPAPDGAMPLARKNTVILLSKHSPIKKQLMVGGDGILPPAQKITAPRPSLVALARLKGIALRKAVDDSIKAVPSSGNTKAKRAKVWAAKVKQEKAKKNPTAASASGKDKGK